MYCRHVQENANISPELVSKEFKPYASSRRQKAPGPIDGEDGLGLCKIGRLGAWLFIHP
jgi:hypothetical protein